jgi:hypothetical protein
MVTGLLLQFLNLGFVSEDIDMALRTRPLSFFPTIALPKLSRMRGRKWTRLVERVADLPETHPEVMAYTLLMRRLGEQVNIAQAGLCVMPSCVECALEILELHDGSERDLMEQYHHALDEVQSFVAGLEKAVTRAA